MNNRNEWHTVNMGMGVVFTQALVKGYDGNIYLSIRGANGEFISDVLVDQYVNDASKD